MIVCSCTRLTQRELAGCVAEVMAEEPFAIVTPGRLFHRSGRRIECGCCCQLVDRLIAEALKERGGEPARGAEGQRE